MNPHTGVNARALLDDPAAVSALRSRLLRYAMRNLAEADAEDVTQETLLALLGAVDRYRGTAHVDTYAHAVLRHKTVDVYRAHAKELPYAPEALQAAIERESADSQQSNDPAEEIDARRRTDRFWRTLRECLRGLPERTCVMFELRDVLGLDLTLVCRQLGITCNHGGVLAHRARAHVRRKWPAAR